MADPKDPTQPNVAAGLYQLEQLRVKLIIGRLITIGIGLAIWWFVLVPAFGGAFIPAVVSLLIVLFGGLWVGTMATLSLVSGRH